MVELVLPLPCARQLRDSVSSPTTIWRLVLTLIDKPKGGKRGIAKLPGLYRVWARARRCLAAEWLALWFGDRQLGQKVLLHLVVSLLPQ